MLNNKLYFCWKGNHFIQDNNSMAIFSANGDGICNKCFFIKRRIMREIPIFFFERSLDDWELGKTHHPMRFYQKNKVFKQKIV